MIAAIAAHLAIGLGALACSKCSQKICTCPRHVTYATGVLLVIEAIASVLIIDRIFHV